MRHTGLDHLRRWLTANDPRVALAAAVAVAVATGLVVGALLGSLGPLLALGAIGAIVVALLMLRSTEWGLLALPLLICLLPYAAMPFDIGFRPTFLDLVLLALFGVWLLRLITKQQRTFEISPLGLPILAFALWSIVTFLSGLAHSPLNVTVLRRYSEVLLAISLVFVAVNQVRDLKLMQRITAALIIAGGGAGFLGFVFYILPGNLTVSILSKLSVFNYPSGAGILRYVEDDPSQPMRAIATSIDPNALGGLLVIVTAVAVVQLFSEQPALPRRILLPLTGFMGLSLLLTFSRGSMVGLGAALLIVGILRYRKLLLLLLLAAILILLLPQTQVYVTRFLQGIQGQDLATQMRFGEYKDALILIERYPILGVGFAGTPDIDIYLGVSSLYLLVAEQVGLVGLFLFLVIVIVFLTKTYAAWRSLPTTSKSQPESQLEGYILAYQTALIGALVAGIFDHFFFNINFIHLVSIFWLVMGMGMAAARLAPALESVTASTRKM